jgi:hypothetical protein
MFFFNDEFDLHDEDQYDLFTLATHIQRRRSRAKNPVVTKRQSQCIIEFRIGPSRTEQ